MLNSEHITTVVKVSWVHFTFETFPILFFISFLLLVVLLSEHVFMYS